MVNIVTDSTCDLSPEELHSLNVHMIPLTISVNGNSYRDREDISAEEFIRQMSQAKELPKSSQPSIGEMIDLFDRLGKDQKEVIAIMMSGKLSGTVETARAAGEQSSADVTVMDSKYISKALGFQVREAARMAEQGASRDEIISRINEVREGTHLYVVVDTLENLVKGGRIGKGKALIGSLLNIKPIAILEDGEYSPVVKVRSQTQAVKYIMKQFMDTIKGKKIKYVGIAHANGLDLALQIKSRIEEMTGFKMVEISTTSPVISTHTGQGAIGFSFFAE